ncbi:hypothetical protein [Roseateles sp.]|uniref:hypothetical protein n=1 Tax=Roseateles sp. TaxID=1971397 RepID=UPI003BACF97B
MAERKHQYEPAAQLTEVPGVRVERNWLYDVYRGTPAELVAMGLAPAAMFPGEPGMPLVSVTLWPRGTEHRSGWNVPGRLHLSRTSKGTFTAALVVSAEEQETRRAAEAVRQAERDAKERASCGTPTADEQEHARAANIEIRWRVLDAAIDQLGLDEVAARVEQLRRERRPARSAGHLKVVWCGPGAEQPRLQ